MNRVKLPEFTPLTAVETSKEIGEQITSKQSAHPEYSKHPMARSF